MQIENAVVDNFHTRESIPGQLPPYLLSVTGLALRVGWCVPHTESCKQRLSKNIQKGLFTLCQLQKGLILKENTRPFFHPLPFIPSRNMAHLGIRRHTVERKKGEEKVVQRRSCLCEVLFWVHVDCCFPPQMGLDFGGFIGICLSTGTFPTLSAPFKASHPQGWLPLQRKQKDLTWKCFLKDRKGNWPGKFHPSSSWTNLCLVLLALLLSSPAFGVEAFWYYLYKENNIRVTFLLHSLKGDWTITMKIVTFRWQLY